MILYSPAANECVDANDIKKVMYGRFGPGFMPLRMQWSMGNDDRVKVAKVKLAWRKVRPLKRHTVKWCAVEVCGFGVPLP